MYGLRTGLAATSLLHSASASAHIKVSNARMERQIVWQLFRALVGANAAHHRLNIEHLLLLQNKPINRFRDTVLRV